MTKKGDIGYALMNDVDYSVYWQLFHRDSTFLPTKRKINGVTKLVCTYFDNRIYIRGLGPLKKALKHGLILRKCICCHKI